MAAVVLSPPPHVDLAAGLRLRRAEDRGRERRGCAVGGLHGLPEAFGAEGEGDAAEVFPEGLAGFVARHVGLLAQEGEAAEDSAHLFAVGHRADPDGGHGVVEGWIGLTDRDVRHVRDDEVALEGEQLGLVGGGERHGEGVRREVPGGGLAGRVDQLGGEVAEG